MLEPLIEFSQQISGFSESDLDAHRRIAKLYCDQRLYMPAITLFREWIISAACKIAGYSDDDIFHEEKRKKIEGTLGHCLDCKKEKRQIPNEPQWLHSDAGQTLINLWIKIPHIRNDVDHAGMRKSPMSTKRLIENIRNLLSGNTTDQLNTDPSSVTIDLSTLYQATETAKLDDLPEYEQAIRDRVPPGAEVTLTGAAPVWMYLRLAHTSHGIAKKLTYDSPVTGKVVVFDHSPD